jgi:hypothetical protein
VLGVQRVDVDRRSFVGHAMLGETSTQDGSWT